MAALGILAVFATSCGGGGLPKMSYYALRMPPPPPGNDPKTNWVLGVERFRVPEMLRDDRIVYYASPTELNFYEYHRWSANPGTMLSQLAARALGEMGIFAQVRLYPAHELVDYTLRGRLFDFEEVDTNRVTQARVALELTLVRGEEGTVVWSATRQVERPVEQPGVPGVVKALNSASEELLREALAGLVAEVEREFRQAQAGPKESPAPQK